MGRYVTRTNEIDAVEVQIENAAELKALLKEDGDIRPYEEHDFAAVVVTARGVCAATPGMFVLRDIDGLHVSSAEAFNAIYEPVAEKAAK